MAYHCKHTHPCTLSNMFVSWDSVFKIGSNYPWVAGKGRQAWRVFGSDRVLLDPVSYLFALRPWALSISLNFESFISHTDSHILMKSSRIERKTIYNHSKFNTFAMERQSICFSRKKRLSLYNWSYRFWG